MLDTMITGNVKSGPDSYRVWSPSAAEGLPKARRESGVGNPELHHFSSPDSYTGKTRMIVRKGLGFAVLKLEDIVLFYTEHKLTYVIDRENKKYISEKNLGQLETILNRNLFFRANRQYILNLDFIKSYKPCDKVKLQVDLNLPELGHFIVVSQDTAPQFREWMNQA